MEKEIVEGVHGVTILGMGVIILSTFIKIKKFDISEQDQARSIILEGLGEHFGYIDETCNPDIDDIDDNYIKKGDLFIVAYSNYELVGTGALTIETEEVVRLVRISVSKTYRKKGVGKRIVEYLLEEAKWRGYGRIVVSTNINWAAAICLYENCGFKEYDRDNVEVHMYKNLFSCALSD